MKVSKLPFQDYVHEIPDPVPYRDAKKNNSGGCYIIWATSDMREKLSELEIQIHSSTSVFEAVHTDKEKPSYSESKIRYSLMPIIDNAATDTFNDENLFCLYVGKTANLGKRHPHRFTSFFSNLRSTRDETVAIQFDRNECYLSFIEEADWQDRFYLENLLIAGLKPVINLQPER